MNKIIENISGSEVALTSTYDFNSVDTFDFVLFKYGLIKTIDTFCDYIQHCFNIHAGYTFDHIVLGDYNLGDGSIDFCLQNDVIMDWFYDQYNHGLSMNYLSDNVWENHQWYELVDATTLIITFLEWLKTIPETVRDKVGY